MQFIVHNSIQILHVMAHPAMFLLKKKDNLVFSPWSAAWALKKNKW